MKSVKHNKRILFDRMAPYPQRKVITFNRYNTDFAFDINYGDLSFLTKEDIRLDGSTLHPSARMTCWEGSLSGSLPFLLAAFVAVFLALST